MLNVENIDRLIAYYDRMDEPVPNWSWDYCFAGVLRDHFDVDTYSKHSDDVIAEFLGTDMDNAAVLSYRNPVMWDLTLSEQKSTIRHALTSLRDTGEAKWGPAPERTEPPVNIEDQMAVDSDTDPNDH